jgi:8-oxo-dGTP diphosphatase
MTWAGALARSSLAGLWKRLGGFLQWRLLWLRNDAFIIGLSGVVLDDSGRVLLLEHRWWTGNPWGLPSGYAERGETWEAGFAREVREETGLEVHDVRVVGHHSGFRLRVEVHLVARASGTPRADGREVLRAAFVDPEDLPAGLRPDHARRIRDAAAG